MSKKVGRKAHGFFQDERAIHEIILLKRRARKGFRDRDGDPMPTPYAVIARELNKEGYRTQSDKPWYGRLVCRILKRLEKGDVKSKRRKKSQLESRDYLTNEEIAMCRAVYRGPEGLLFETLLRTGLRASELCALEVRDLGIYRGKNQIDVREGKGCKSRTVFLGPQIRVALNNHVSYRAGITSATGAGNRPVFENQAKKRIAYSNLYYRIKSIGRRARLDHLHPHALRHTFARTLYNYKNNLEHVQQQLGHASISTTVIYAKTATDKRLQEMEEVDDLFSPKPKPEQSQ